MNAAARKLHRPHGLRGFENVPRHWDSVHGSWIAQVLPGTYCVSNHDEIIATILGSCVSTCIRDGDAGVGGVNHFMLPTDPRGDTNEEALRYGSFAVERLINELIKYGARRERMEVKVFGGGNVIASQTDIGLSNIKFVRAYLRDEMLAIAAEDVGGHWARRLRYHPLTGRAFVKHLPMGETSKVATKERALAAALSAAPIGTGGVELF